jgi:hypothetical protein
MRATLVGSLLTVATLTTQTGWAATLTFQDSQDQVIDTASISGFIPKAITSGDFDVDGSSLTDIAVTDTGNNTLVILPGNGDTTFGTADTSNTTGTSPNSVVSADLDGVNGADLVTANSNSDNLSVFLSNGSGGFNAATSYSTGANTTPVLVVAADLDGDTIPDLASINKRGGGGSVSVFINDGSANFTAGTSISNHLSKPVGAVAADLNGDTDIDLAIINQGDNSVSIFLNDGGGSGTFTFSNSYTTGDTPYAIAAGDLIGGDNMPELVVSNSGSGSNTISVFTNDGSGGFNTKNDYTTLSTPEGVVVDDLDQDGDLDIAVASSGADIVSVFKNDGSGSFSNRDDFSSLQGPSGLATGDLDKDGYPELLVTNLNNYKVSYLENLTPVTPDTFTFPDVKNATLGSTVTSASVTISGLATPAPISINTKSIPNPITGTSIDDAKYSIGNNGTFGIFTSESGTISNGQQVRIQLNIGSNAGSSVTKTLTIGGLDVTFTVTTTGDTTPDTFTIIPYSDANPGEVVTSAPVTITGLGGPATILISNGEYSIGANGIYGAFTSASGVISNGQTLKVRLTASSSYGSQRQALVSVGGVQAAFIVTTKSGSSSSSGGGGGSLSPWLGLLVCLWRRKYR